MIHYAWIIAFTGTLVTILAHGFGRMSYSIILPSLKDGLMLNYTQLGSIASGNFIGYLALATSGGFLATRFGVRKVVFISLLVMGISLFLTGLANSFLFALLMRLITGVGNGGSYVPIMALPATWFITKKRGLATGIVSAGIGLGLFLSGIIIPPILSGFGKEGWRYAWFCLGIIVFASAFVCYAFLRDDPQEKGVSMYGGEEEKRATRGSLFSAFKDVVIESELWKLGGVYFMYGFSYVIYLTFFVAYLTKEIGLFGDSSGKNICFVGDIKRILRDHLRVDFRPIRQESRFYKRLFDANVLLLHLCFMEGLPGILFICRNIWYFCLCDSYDYGCSCRRCGRRKFSPCCLRLHYPLFRYWLGLGAVMWHLDQGYNRNIYLGLYLGCSYFSGRSGEFIFFKAS